MIQPLGKNTRNVYSGTANREQFHALPKGVGWKWESSLIVLARDGASEASNRASIAWENSYIIDNVSAWHASNRWFQKHNTIFKNTDNIGKIKDNFNLCKDCTKMNHVSLWKEMMLNHWRNEYKEGVVADALEKSWGNNHLTKVEANKKIH